MPIIVEDGTALPDAESYCTTLFVTQYLNARGKGADWGVLDTTRKEQLLREATEYIEGRFGGKFRGQRNSDEQALSFPRNGETTVPVAVQRATAEYAVRALAGPLVSDPVTDSSGLQVKSFTKKLGPLEKRTEYDTAKPSLFKAYPAADMLLKSLLRTTGLIR